MTFYYGSGSPFSWYVWLVLKRKQLPHALKLMPLLGSDLKTPEYLTINPRGKVSVLMDDGFARWESSVIVAYDRPLLPQEPKDRAISRRIAAEAHTYLYPPLRRLMEPSLITRKEDKAALSLPLQALAAFYSAFNSMLRSLA